MTYRSQAVNIKELSQPVYRAIRSHGGLWENRRKHRSLWIKQLLFSYSRFLPSKKVELLLPGLAIFLEKPKI